MVSVTWDLGGTYHETWYQAKVLGVSEGSTKYGRQLRLDLQVIDDNGEEHGLSWWGPLVATGKNKTGRLLMAFGAEPKQGGTVNMRSLIGRECFVFIEPLTEGDTLIYRVKEVVKDEPPTE